MSTPRISITAALEGLAGLIRGGAQTGALWNGTPFGLVVETSVPNLEVAIEKSIECGPCLAVVADAVDLVGDNPRMPLMKLRVSVGVLYVPGLNEPPAPAIEIAESFGRLIHGAAMSAETPSLLWKATGLQPIPEGSALSGWRVLCEITLPMRG
jgi:hypothetical protein